MIAPLAVVVALTAGAARPADDALARAIETARRGELRAAYALAEKERDPVRKAQAVLYVRHQAGDLGGALRAGLAGLETAPNDAWLLERTAYLALSLRDPDLSRSLVGRLDRALESANLEADERARWETLAAARREEAAALDAAAARRSDAARLARVVACGGLAIAIGALIFLLVRVGPPSVRTGR